MWAWSERAGSKKWGLFIYLNLNDYFGGWFRCPDKILAKIRSWELSGHETAQVGEFLSGQKSSKLAPSGNSLQTHKQGSSCGPTKSGLGRHTYRTQCRAGYRYSVGSPTSISDRALVVRHTSQQYYLRGNSTSSLYLVLVSYLWHPVSGHYIGSWSWSSPRCPWQLYTIAPQFLHILHVSIIPTM
jgi:hypothetical protein